MQQPEQTLLCRPCALRELRVVLNGTATGVWTEVRITGTEPGSCAACSKPGRHVLTYTT